MVESIIIGFGSVMGICAMYLLWLFAKRMDRIESKVDLVRQDLEYRIERVGKIREEVTNCIERDVDDIRLSTGLPPYNDREYAQKADIRHQETMKRLQESMKRA